MPREIDDFSDLRSRGEIQRRLRKASHDMLGLEVQDTLELEILSILVDGPRTPAELVDWIYKYSRTDPGYMTCYTKTRRTL